METPSTAIGDLYVDNVNADHKIETFFILLQSKGTEPKTLLRISSAGRTRYQRKVSTLILRRRVIPCLRLTVTN